MLEQVQGKIEELQKVQAEEYYKKKESDLRSWGLVSKKENGKVTPIIVTDEEYAALIKASNGVSKTSRNSIAVLLNALSIATIVVAAIAGIVLEALVDELSFVYMSVAFVIGIVFAAVLKGVSEAIRLLQQIVDDKPIKAPTEAMRKTDVPKPERIVTVQNPATQQSVVIEEQPIIYHQTSQPALAPQPAPQPMQQMPYQAPYQPQYQPSYQPPYQPQYQPQYQQPTMPPQHQPGYSTQRFEESYEIKDPSGAPFGE